MLWQTPAGHVRLSLCSLSFNMRKIILARHLFMYKSCSADCLKTVSKCSTVETSMSLGMTNPPPLRPENCFSFRKVSFTFPRRDPVRILQHCSQTFFRIFLTMYPDMYVRTFFSTVFSCSLGNMNATFIRVALSPSWCCTGSGMSCRGKGSTCGVLPMASRLTKNFSPSSRQLLVLLCLSTASTIAWRKKRRKCLGSGLSMCPPLPLTTENKFSIQSWLRRLVIRYLRLCVLWSSSHSCSRLWIEIFQPVMHGNFRELPDSRDSSHNKVLWRNSLWPEVWLNECRMLWLLVKLLLLKVLNSLSMCSTNSAVSIAAGSKAFKVTIVEMPAATLCDNTCVAYRTFRLANAGRSICFLVSFGAIRTLFVESTWKNWRIYPHSMSLPFLAKPLFFRLFLILLMRWGGSYIRNILLSPCQKYGLSSETPRAFTAFTLFDPWSQTTVLTSSPNSVTWLMHCRSSDFSRSPLIGPLDKKYPTGCFQGWHKPRTMKTVAWLATKCVLWSPKSSTPST